jgi:hypothetical protein
MTLRISSRAAGGRRQRTDGIVDNPPRAWRKAWLGQRARPRRREPSPSCAERERGPELTHGHCRTCRRALAMAMTLKAHDGCRRPPGERRRRGIAVGTCGRAENASSEVQGVGRTGCTQKKRTRPEPSIGAGPGVLSAKRPCRALGVLGACSRILQGRH